ncbi:leucine-rich repeat extensin-like protein 4 [Dorcoceras hygrometricum]|uniref:Leucine-rich repeat extensin-like protein 4 n=1 Tax=Dorcoceras hygrometricum TaxID=472368 RepID=A0A2Z7BR85_9LAMI|nr:leucine-rich repeat extensin-like protein 4 [Dorcoceras hygrometricum]
METSWILALLLPIIATQAALGLIVGGGVGIGVGGGIGGGGSGGDDPKGILGSWVGPNVCSYKGVFCSETRDFMGNPAGKVVAAIDLNHANLQGVLVKELSFLTDLSLLHLNSNRFAGTVPSSFRELESLTELDLSNNKFSGPFPTTALYIPNLLYLDLRFNSFSGPIPEDLFNTKLDAIFLNNNQFDGEIPENLGNSPASVIVLDVSSNTLTGHLPDSLSCLSEIEVLNFGNNKFSGTLPDLVCSLRTLLNLTLSVNFFSGFSQDCDRLLFRNVGFDFSLNCIPGKEFQRPWPDCSAVPGGGLSCLRIPSPKPLVCGTLVEALMNSASSTP